MDETSVALANQAPQPEEEIRTLTGDVVNHYHTTRTSSPGAYANRTPMPSGEARLSSYGSAPGITLMAKESDASSSWKAHFYTDSSTENHVGKDTSEVSVELTVGEDSRPKASIRGTADDIAKLATHQAEFADHALRKLAETQTVVLNSAIANEDLGEITPQTVRGKIDRLVTSAQERNLPPQTIENRLGSTADFNTAVTASEFLEQLAEQQRLYGSEGAVGDAPYDMEALTAATSDFQTALMPVLVPN